LIGIITGYPIVESDIVGIVIVGVCTIEVDVVDLSEASTVIVTGNIFL